MLVEAFAVGPFQSNCFVLACERTRQAVIVDPGHPDPRIMEAVERHRLTVGTVLHTHAHVDHVGGTGSVTEATGAKVALHEGDRALYSHAVVQGMTFGLRIDAPPPPDVWLADGDEIAFGDDGHLRVLHTPGHSPGGVCFFAEGDGLVLTGDTLFAGSVGRTDLPGGSWETLLASIQSRLLTLDDEVVVLPGHGPASSIGEERRYNPFLR